MTDVTAQQASVPGWQRRLLPGDLLEAPDGRRSARDWVFDVVLFSIAVGIGVTTLVTTEHDHSATLAVVDIVLGTAACLAIWLRRGHPIGVAVFVVSVASFSAVASGAAPIALFNTAVRASPRALVGVASLSFASIAIFPLVYPSVGSLREQLLFGGLVMVVMIGWGLFTRARRELVSSLRERAERLESEQRLRVEQAREAERRRIAREMHDVLAHRITLLSVHAGALEYRPDASAEEVAEAAGVIRASAQSALQELRAVIGVLRDDLDEDTPQPPQPTLAQIPVLVEESRAAGMHVRWRDGTTGTEGIPDGVGRTAYRVVQEGLTNARKHAPAATVDVRLESGPPLVVEVVSRRAVGATSAGELGGTGTGLIGLTERVALADGELRHGPDPAGDFVLRASLPWTP